MDKHADNDFDLSRAESGISSGSTGGTGGVGSGGRATELSVELMGLVDSKMSKHEVLYLMKDMEANMLGELCLVLGAVLGARVDFVGLEVRMWCLCGSCYSNFLY